MFLFFDDDETDATGEGGNAASAVLTAARVGVLVLSQPALRTDEAAEFNESLLLFSITTSVDTVEFCLFGQSNLALFLGVDPPSVVTAVAVPFVSAGGGGVSDGTRTMIPVGGLRYVLSTFSLLRLFRLQQAAIMTALAVFLNCAFHRQ
jgi:hypothetical protein